MVVEIRTGRPLEEKGGFAKIAGGNSANYATSSQNAAAVTAYVEHAIARCIPFQQLEDGIKNPWLMTGYLNFSDLGKYLGFRGCSTQHTAPQSLNLIS